MSNQERIAQTADEILDALEAPIGGIPSVSVRHRGNAKRLLVAALTAIWETKPTIEYGQSQVLPGAFYGPDS